MEEIQFDGKTYKVETYESSKSDPQLDNAVGLRIEEENGEQRASVWEITHTEGKHLLSLERDDEIPDLRDPDQQFTVTGSDFIALQHFLRNFKEYTELEDDRHIITTADTDLSDLFSELTERLDNIDESDSMDLLQSMIKSISKFSQEVDEIEIPPELASEDAIRAHSMLKLASVRKANDRLEEIIRNDESEDECQTHLERHPWMLGNQYTGILDRDLIHTGVVDFALRSVSGFLDVIELKRPDMDPMNIDTSHDTYYPRAELTKSISQISDYIRELEREEDRIARDEDINPVKPRGVIIIGSDLDEEAKEGLKVYESHLDRIEIITYSDLLQRGRRIERLYEREGELELVEVI